MKYLMLLIISLSVYSAPISKTIDELLDESKKEKLFIPTYDPFKRAQPLLQRKSEKKQVYKAQPIVLVAIMNDKAFFNGRWYKKGESSSLGKISKITATHVYFKKGKTIKVLKLQKNKSRFKIKTRDFQ